jgi:hypothetical protein
MRTTLDLDDDVLRAVKQVAAATGKTAGEAASELIRRGLTEVRQLQQCDGLLLFPEPTAGVRVTVELVNRLFDVLP